MAATHKPIEKGLEGTDNCPVCGQAMSKSIETVLGQRVVVLTCDQPGHNQRVILHPDSAQAMRWASKPLAGLPGIVCLCGSTRFVDEFNRQRQELTERGQIVLSIEIVTTQATHEDPQHVDPELKARLDTLHLRKIDLADVVYVLNVDGYIGDSTRAEIKYAVAQGKPVQFLEPESRNSTPKAPSSL